MIEGKALEDRQPGGKDIQGGDVIGVCGEAAFDAYEVRLSFSVVFRYTVTRRASSGGVHRGYRDDIASGPSGLVFQHPSVFGPSLVPDGSVQPGLLLDIAARLSERTAR